MKLKRTSVFLLMFLFLILGLLSGAIPVLAEDKAPSDDIPSAAELLAADTGSASSPTPQPSAEPRPTGTPPPTKTPAPAGTPRPTAAPSSVTVIPTTITSDSMLDNDTYYNIDPESLLKEASTFTLPAEGYQILIIHTHGTEAYTPEGTDVYEPSDDYRTTDTNYSVIRVGRALAEALRAYGLNVLHDEGLYDYPSYTSSYVRSGQAIEEYLEAYPGISLVIDLHRDALGDGDTIYKTVTQAEGTQAAQLMFVMGSDINLEHPYWQDNLSLALTLQNAVSSRHPELMRPTTLCAYRYNQQLTAGSLLMEVGTSGNSLQEAITAVQLFADAAAPWLLSRVAE